MVKYGKLELPILIVSHNHILIFIIFQKGLEETISKKL